MTVSDETPKSGPYSCDGTNRVWDYTFTLPGDDTDYSNLNVYVTDSDGLETQVTTNIYINVATKEVTYPLSGQTDPLPVGSTIEIRLEEPVSNTYDPTIQPFDSDGFAGQMDKLTRLIQQTRVLMDDIEISGGGGGGGVWGAIAGTLSNQTDLQSALNAKSATTHNHSGTYAASANGVTNGDSHDHSGGDGAQISYGNLSNVPSTFAPASHDHSSNKLNQANTHESADTDSATTSLHHTLGTGANQACAGNDGRLSDARTPASHDHSSNKLNQANTHESADTDSATSALHHTLGTGANNACAGNDSRLSDARTPAAHSQSVTTITSLNSTISFQIGNGSEVPATGAYCLLAAPFPCTINSWYICGNASGSAVVDIKAGGTSLVGGSGNKPTLSTAQTATAAISSWTTSTIAQNDLLTVNLDSVSTCKLIEVQLRVTRT
jgi:hypothetical protein